MQVNGKPVDGTPFQSTHPSGVRRSPRKLVEPTDSISIHAPQWGATIAVLSPAKGVDYFNPRTPVGCDTTAACTCCDACRFQSTHPSGVRPDDGGTTRRTLRISIHAPQWGATATGVPSRLQARNFNPRTPVGCDPTSYDNTQLTHNFNPRTPVGCDGKSTTTASCPAYFNPRTPVGCDDSAPILGPPFMVFQSTHPSGVRLDMSRNYDCNPLISIHAPQWGATVAGRTITRRLRNFNPRTPVGCDMVEAPPASMALLFQSTHPSGVRREKFQDLRVIEIISIHAPQWGATRPTSLSSAPHGISIHAPQWGATEKFQDLRVIETISIHAPQWGATQTACR